MEKFKVRVTIKHEYMADIGALDEGQAIKVAKLQAIESFRYLGKSAPEYTIEKDVDV